jgi:hypothetical protein
MQDALKDLLEKRRNRAIAIVLGVKERECDQDLSAMASQKLRMVVLDQFNEFHDLVLDIMGSLDKGEVVLNEAWLTKIDEIHDMLSGRK